MRRATVAVAPMLSPMASVYSTIMSASVRPIVATAAAPSRPTKYTSATAKRLSMSISTTIGTARRRIARPIGPCV